ncbi:MAG: hypothetical protein DSY70_00700 [Desulfobulbus sp.]|nr:MAG: hypothetical protein DSY70_00700 [Desulfobulbus sp.]
MKNLFLLTLLLLLMGGFMYQLMYHRVPYQDPLELVASDCVLMVDWTDASASARDFFNSRFGRNLTSIDWPYVLDQLAVSADFRKRLEEKSAAVIDCFSSPLCKKIFASRVVFALLPAEQTTVSGRPETPLGQRVILVATLKSRLVLPALLSSMAWLKGKVRRLTYRGRTIKRLELASGGNVYFALIDGNLVASPGRSAIEQSIDLLLQHRVQEQTGLLTNQNYRELRKRYRGNDFFIYADIPRLTSFFHLSHFSQQSAGEAGSSQLSGVKQIALFHSTDSNTQRLITLVKLSPDQLTNEQKKLYSRRPVLNSRLPDIPSELVMYFWSNWLDLSGWWEEVVSSSGKSGRETTDKMSAWIRQKTGLEIDQFLSLFGQEFGINVTQIRTSGFFPVPSLCCFLELEEPAMVAGILEKGLSGLTLWRDTIDGVPVVSVMIAHGLMRPSYAVLDNYLLVADSRKQIEQLLAEKTSRLLDDELFKTVDTGMSKPANVHLFARTSLIVDSIKELVSWVGTVVAVRDGAAGKKSKILVDQVILPLLDGLKTFKAKSVRGYAGPGEVIFDAVVLTEPAN